MIVADTSALISLASADTIETAVSEFDVYTTETVLEELRMTAEYDDTHGNAAKRVLRHESRFNVRSVTGPSFDSGRIDDGEASCVHLVQEIDAAFLLTDDFRALPELQAVVDSRVAISPILLKALVKRDVLKREEAQKRLETLASRDRCHRESLNSSSAFR